MQSSVPGGMYYIYAYVYTISMKKQELNTLRYLIGLLEKNTFSRGCS